MNQMAVLKTKRSSNKVPKSRKQILDAAAALFSQHGFDATSLREIASAVNMKAGSLYYHFESKEALILEVLNIGIENIHQNVQNRISSIPENSPFSLILEEAIKGHLEALLEKGDYTSTNIRNYGQIPISIQKLSLDIRNSYEDLWRELLEEGARKGEIKPGVDLKILRLSLLGMLNRTIEWYHEGGLSVDEIAIDQARFFLVGISSESS
ncbi:MAG: TetR/AcrR family transcriptional regulator [Methylococcales bacterium]